MSDLFFVETQFGFLTKNPKVPTKNHFSKFTFQLKHIFSSVTGQLNPAICHLKKETRRNKNRIVEVNTEFEERLAQLKTDLKVESFYR